MTPLLTTDEVKPYFSSGTVVLTSGRGQPIMAGPVPYDIEWHPLIPFFLVMGKLVYCRRMTLPDHPDEEQDYRDSYRQWLSSYADQIVKGDAKDYAHHVSETRGIQLVIERVVGRLQTMAEAMDEQMRSMLEGQVAVDLYLDPADPLPERVDQLIGYMASNGITLQDRDRGFHHYLMQAFQTSDGLPAVFPVDGNANVLDAWITSRVIPVPPFGQPAS